MARAKLCHAVAVDCEVHEASRVDHALFDPVVRIDGDVPGLTRPFRVVRYYLGPQGAYAERFVLRDPGGRERSSSVVGRIQLEGQMRQNRFSSTLRGVWLDSDEEHHLTFYLDDEPMGSVPVFVEADARRDGEVPAADRLASALAQGDVLTVTVAQADGDSREDTVWFVNAGDRVYVVTGPGEQQVPELSTTDTVRVAVRDGGAGPQPVEAIADVRLVPPGNATYHDFARRVLDGGVNLVGRVEPPDPREALRRWAQTCQLVELTPRLGRGAQPAVGVAAPPGRTAPAAAPGGQQSFSKQAGRPNADSSDHGRGDVQVEPRVDQQVYDQLIAEGKSERLARSKAKAAYVRAEKQRLVGEHSA